MKKIVLGIVLGLVAATAAGPSAQQAAPAPVTATVVILRPTDHPPLPSDPSQIWMTPSRAQTTRTAALTALRPPSNSKLTATCAALPVLSGPLLRDHVLNEYVLYYKGLAELSANRTSDALRTFQSLSATAPEGYLLEAAALRQAECREALSDYPAAIEIYERLSKARTMEPDTILMRLGLAAQTTGDFDRAAKAFSRVYYEFPFSDLGPAASLALERLPNRPPLEPGSPRFQQELGRAEQLFSGKRYALARSAFEALKPLARGDDLELVNLRLAETDYFLKRLRVARDGVKPYIDGAKRQGEALFFYAVSLYGLGDRAEYFSVVRRLADDFPTQTWAEEALNNLATHFILDDQDDKADEVFREMFARFPSGRYAERAAWKIGWLSYRNRDYRTPFACSEGGGDVSAIGLSPAVALLVRRAYDAPLDAQADARSATAADHFNSYYGRLAFAHLDGRVSAASTRRSAGNHRCG